MIFCCYELFNYAFNYLFNDLILSHFAYWQETNLKTIFEKKKKKSYCALLFFILVRPCTLNIFIIKVIEAYIGHSSLENGMSWNI